MLLSQWRMLSSHLRYKWIVSTFTGSLKDIIFNFDINKKHISHISCLILNYYVTRKPRKVQYSLKILGSYYFILSHGRFPLLKWIWEFVQTSLLSLRHPYRQCKGQLNSEWIYEVIVSPKIPTHNLKDFCPGSLLEGRAEILQIFGWHFGRNDNLIN